MNDSMPNYYAIMTCKLKETSVPSPKSRLKVEALSNLLNRYAWMFYFNSFYFFLNFLSNHENVYICIINIQSILLSIIPKYNIKLCENHENNRTFLY